MRKVSLLLVLLVVGMFVHAQDRVFKPFKVDIALGYANPSGGGGARGGVLFAIEPKYALNDNFALGLRFEGAVMVRANIDRNGEDVSGEAKASGSYLATADYYFNTNKFRPFVGLGAGLYQTATADVSSNPSQEDVATANKFGFAQRIGFEYGHFRTGIEYNVAGKTGTVNNNYLGVKLGFFIGGGRFEY